MYAQKIDYNTQLKNQPFIPYLAGQGSFATQCGSAKTSAQVLRMTTQVTGLPTQTITCDLDIESGGSLQPTTGAVITVNNFTCSAALCFDTSVGGPGSIILAKGYAQPEYFGATAYPFPAPGSSMGADSAQAFEGAAHSVLPNGGGKLELHAGMTYYCKSSQTIQFPCFDFPITTNEVFEGNGATIDYSGMPNQGVSAQVMTLGPVGQTQFQAICTLSCVAMDSATVGQITITVADGTKFAVGHEIFIVGGGNGDGSEANTEMNVVTAINGDVLTLQTPLGKAYAMDLFYPSEAVDVDQYTTKNFLVENMTLVGDGVFPVITIQNDGQVFRNVSLRGPGENNPLDGNNRNWTFDNYYAEIQPAATCPDGGFIQIALNSSFVEIKNSTFDNQSDTNCLVGVNEGSFNVKFHNNLGYNTGFGIAEVVGGGYEQAYDNTMFITGSASWLGVFTNNCCGGTIFPVSFVRNTVYSSNVNAYTITVGGASKVDLNVLTTASTTQSPILATGLTGGSISGNIINGPATGITVVGSPDFPVNNNTITGNGTTNSNCILYTTSITQPAGPLAVGNHCNNFQFGISIGTSNLSYLSGRGVGPNTFENISSSIYRPAALAMTQLLGANGTFQSVMGLPYDSAFDPGLGVLGKLLARPNGIAGAIPGATDYVVADCGATGCAMSLLGQDAAQEFLYFRHITSGYTGYIGHSVVSTVPEFVLNPDGNTAHNFLVYPTGVTVGSLVGSTGSGGKPLCIVPASGVEYIASGSTCP